jgi:hypothetical protein
MVNGRTGLSLRVGIETGGVVVGTIKSGRWQWWYNVPTFNVSTECGRLSDIRTTVVSVREEREFCTTVCALGAGRGVGRTNHWSICAAHWRMRGTCTVWGVQHWEKQRCTVKLQTAMLPVHQRPTPTILQPLHSSESNLSRLASPLI